MSRRPGWGRRRARAVRTIVAALGLCAGIAAPPASAASLSIGGTPDDPADATFIPFGGLTLELRNAIDTAVLLGEPLPVPRFQQVYDASSFGSLPVRISQVSFAQSASQLPNAGLLGGTSCSGVRSECGLFTLRISTTQKPVNGLDEPSSIGSSLELDSNLTPSMTEVFAAQILLSDVSSGGMLTFSGPNFRYDPLQDGNLILDITISEFGTSTDLTQGLGSLAFQATDSAGFPGDDAPYSVADNFDGLDNSSFGLVTTFEVEAVPEPSTALLLGAGLSALAWRRRNAARTAR